MKNIHLITTQKLPFTIFGHQIQPIQGKQEHFVDVQYTLVEFVNAKKEFGEQPICLGNRINYTDLTF